MEPEKWAMSVGQRNDALTLREATRVIRRRRKRRTFVSDVLIRALENMARRMETGDG
jgi:hypothetical protein